MKLRTLVIIALAMSPALMGASCQVLTDIENFQTIASGSVSPAQVYTVANAFDAIEGTATTYLRLPLCPNGAPVCRVQSTSQTVYTNVVLARRARNSLEAYMNANAGAPIPVSNYNVLVTALQTIGALVNANSATIQAATAATK